VRAPSLYQHVRDKAALLQLAASEAFAGFNDDRAAYGVVRDLTPAWPRSCRPALPDRDQLPGPRGGLVSAQVEALVRLGVPPVAAQAAFTTCASFDRGLRWLLHGLQAELRALVRVPPASTSRA